MRQRRAAQRIGYAIQAADGNDREDEQETACPLGAETMIRFILVSSAVLLFAEVGHSRPTESDAAGFRWEECANKQVKYLASSLDDAEFVVNAALASCDDKKRALSEALSREGLSAPVCKLFVNLFEQDIVRAARIAVLDARQ